MITVIFVAFLLLFTLLLMLRTNLANEQAMLDDLYLADEE